ncbi:MAG TPA: hypothetical protein VNK95_05440 [Caldilineaceae bacterium]|nr:hypothetical protein [Caldilineaceae bacterium]
MLVQAAKQIARQWVLEQARHLPGLVGAFYAGSTAWLADEADLPATSDLDIMVVLDTPRAPEKPGKFRYRDVLLEVTYLSAEQFQSPEQILSHYHLAPSFSRAGLILDPSGRLAHLQQTVARDFAKRPWVVRRCLQARDTVLARTRSLDGSAPLHGQVIPWLFAAGGTPHVLLVAGLRNPTVRLRYLAARALLVEYGIGAFDEPLLELLGCAHLSRERVAHHLAPLAAIFDAAKTLIRTPFPFAGDLSESARPVAIDGSRELIERGDHREAVFWMAVTYSRCQQVLSVDAPAALRERFTPGYRALLADLGIRSPADLKRRCAQVVAFLPQLWTMTETILAANPEIED